MAKLSEIDREALTRALARAKGVVQVEGHRSWREAAEAAAYHLQIRNLRLKPWEDPPMYGDLEPGVAQPGAAELLARLLKAGLSRYEPEPVEALARVEPSASSATTPAENKQPKKKLKIPAHWTISYEPAAIIGIPFPPKK